MTLSDSGKFGPYLEELDSFLWLKVKNMIEEELTKKRKEIKFYISSDISYIILKGI